MKAILIVDDDPDDPPGRPSRMKCEMESALAEVSPGLSVVVEVKKRIVEDDGEADNWDDILKYGRIVDIQHNCIIVCVHATMPNSAEFCKWIVEKRKIPVLEHSGGGIQDQPGLCLGGMCFRCPESVSSGGELNFRAFFGKWRKSNFDPKRVDKCWKALLGKESEKAVPTQLVAVDILLQGYLAIRKPRSIFGDNYVNFMKQHKILQEEEQHKTAMEKTDYCSPDRQRLFRSFHERAVQVDGKAREPDHLGWYWFDECLPDVESASFDELVAQCDLLQGKNRLRDVWRLLRGECLGKPGEVTLCASSAKIWSQHALTSLFEQAHSEYLSLFLEVSSAA